LSQREASLVLKAYDFNKSGIKKLIDVGGGFGYLVSAILKEHSTMTGGVFEIPQTLTNPDLFSAKQLGVQDRCEYIPGDMFKAETIPVADGYILKHILHDWTDEEVVIVQLSLLNL
jgi:hypothetical protein